MLDTVTGSLKNYSLKKINLFETLPSKVNCFGEQTGIPKVFCNMPNFNVDIKPDETLYWKASLPHLLYGSSYFEIQESDAELCFDSITKNLENAGVQFDKQDIYENKLSRIDFCRNPQMDYPIPDYLFYLSQFRMSRRDKLDWKKETLYFRNRQRELAIYNKVRAINTDVRCKAEREYISGMPENILRFESKFRTGKAINREFGSLNLEKAFNKELCDKVFKKEIDGLIRADNIQLELDLGENHFLMERIKVSQQRNVFTKFLNTKGIMPFLQEFQYNDELIKEFLFMHFKKTQVYDVLGQIRELQVLMMPKEQRELMKEIRLKLAA